MKTAFEILDVPEQVDDATVKKAYLEKVKLFPPERANEQFQQIRDAYEAIKDARSRMQYQLFHLPDTEFEQLLVHAFETPPIEEVDGSHIVKMLQNSTHNKK